MTRLRRPPRLGLPRLSARARAWLLALLCLLAGYLVATARQTLVRPPLVLGQDAVPPVGAAPADTSDTARVTLENVGGPAIRIRPAQGEGGTLLVFYPGGLVRPQAYEWLGRALAAQGVETLIPAFPLDLAVIQPNRADALIARYGKGKRVLVAGHSLGGAMAAGYAAEHAQALSGLILMAAYPAGNVSLREASLPTLSLLAERDGVAAPDAVRGGLERLPAGTTLTVVPGAVHAFFGRYGPQRNDGRPTVTRAQAEGDILRALTAFLARIPSASVQK
ncbi:alpha/beta fold hydrolase [Deinococcus koreensis]|uniref:Alpha/beta hydrolase n=1 Tax=Deinococcus koreensis TaxID=2054903 RepID=A0A2K3V1I9_9DEIO|nr:alpha/beta fold hydrolase [Deinococcus koreensis]PNY82649.1 alpha/beta hydrolase [Deinococcus koreensis]